jgi:hypothetical protein
MCDRTRTYPALASDPLRVVDRFTGQPTVICGAELRDFAVLTIANELDVARHASLSSSTVEGIRQVIAALSPHVPNEAARALGDGALASDDAVEVPDRSRDASNSAVRERTGGSASTHGRPT